MSPIKRDEARTRLLDAAESLFAAKGFDSVTLREVTKDLGLTHASIYYHFPGGKEELFAAVMERNIRRHGEGLGAAMRAGGPRLRGMLLGAAGWFLSQPPMDLIRMAQSDLAVLKPEAAGRLMALIYQLILGRLQGVIEESSRGGEIEACDAGLIAGGLLGMVESLHSVPVAIVRRRPVDMAADLIDVFLRGMGYKQGG